MEEVRALMEELGAREWARGADFKGYEVYIPVYEGEPFIGFPLVVMKKGSEVRLSTNEESIEYLDLC